MIQLPWFETSLAIEFHYNKNGRIAKSPTVHLNRFIPLLTRLSVVMNLVVLFGFLFTAASSSHSFINNHINNIGTEGDNFFEDDVSTGVSLCLPNYEVSEGSIIRTKDSQELGARFLNESDLGVTGREDCLRLCCRTPRCNVAVFEEKVRLLHKEYLFISYP